MAEAVVIDPDVVVELTVIFIPAVIVELMLTLRPAVILTVPSAELSGDEAEIVKSPVAPVDVKLTLPYPPALTAPLTIKVAGDAWAASVILPVPVVVTPLVVKLPVTALNVKLTPVNAAYTSVDGLLFVIV